MNKRNGLTIIFILILIISVGCSSKKEFKTPEELINANAEYLTKEDFDASMSTVHPASPTYEATANMIKQIFERYDLEYKIENIKVLEQSDDEAKVEFTQVTKKIKGPDFKDNRITGIHTLKKDGGSWKVYSTEMVKVDFLNKDEFHNKNN